MQVFVLDKHRKPLMPCSPKRARLMLKAGRARVHKLTPFTIRLMDRLAENSTVQPVLIKIDPDSKKTGLAVVREEEDKTVPLFLADLKHKADNIRKQMT